jgi:hypothetical protein
MEQASTQFAALTEREQWILEQVDLRVLSGLRVEEMRVSLGISARDWEVAEAKRQLIAAA